MDLLRHMPKQKKNIFGRICPMMLNTLWNNVRIVKRTYQAITHQLRWRLEWGNVTLFRERGFCCTLIGRHHHHFRSSQRTSSGLCLVPRQRAGFLGCVKAMFHKKSKEIRAACPFFCEKTWHGSLGVEVGHSICIVTNYSRTLSLNCSLVSPNGLSGTLGVLSPSHCSLRDTLVSLIMLCLT